MAVSLTPPNLVPITTIATGDLLTVWPSGTAGPLSKITFADFKTNVAALLNGNFLQITQNLADVGNATTARTNLGLGSMAIQNAGTVNITGGAIAGVALSSTVTVSNAMGATGGLRPVLNATRTYFVRTDGNDANTGLTNTAGGAFKTIQRGVDVVCSLDFNGNAVFISVQGGSFPNNVTVGAPWIGGGTLQIQGDVANPFNVLVSVTSGDCFKCTTNLTGILYIRGFRMQSTAGSCLVHFGFGQFYWSECDFANANAYHVRCAGSGAQMTANGNYTISGVAAAHIFAYSQASVTISGMTVSISAGGAYPSAFVGVIQGGFINAGGTVFTGAGVAGVTGTRYTGSTNGIINTNTGGANFFPGNVAGVVNTGAQYV